MTGLYGHDILPFCQYCLSPSAEGRGALIKQIRVGTLEECLVQPGDDGGDIGFIHHEGKTDR